MPKTATALFLFRYIIRRNMPPEKQKGSNHRDTKDSSVIHMKNAAGEPLCTIAFDRHCAAKDYKEYCPFVLCTKGEHAGEMVSACGNSRGETEADAQAALDEFMPALRCKAKKLGLDLSTLQILGRSTITVQSDWSADL